MAKRFFIPIRNILNAILDLDVDEIALEIARTNEFKTLVIRLNTEGLPSSQLFELGEDSRGKSLGEYAPSTIEGTSSFEGKKQKGQRFDHVTLKDTGDFYKTFKVTPFKGGFRIDADPIKDETNLFKEWGEDIVGLNDTNLNIIIEFYINAIQEKVKTNIRAA